VIPEAGKGAGKLAALRGSRQQAMTAADAVTIQHNCGTVLFSAEAKRGQ
jgi:hypothetical protein